MEVNFMDKISCKYDKETPNMHRWEKTINNESLKIYINKWRVPNPYPSHISVEIIELDERTRFINYLYPEELRANPELFSKPIVTRITYNEKHSSTFKYKTDLNDDVRETGDIFIPQKLLSSSPPKRLIIVINWENKTEGRFFV